MYRRKMLVTAVLLVICLALLIWASYAWFSLTTAPEIIGVETRVTSNGGLEIALLSDKTYMAPEDIRVSVGDSAVVQKATVSNLTWGNVVDLSDEAYGMDKIALLPARLVVHAGGGVGTVGTNMLSVPDYETDGRVSGFNFDTVSAIYDGVDFTYYTKYQTYGVRAIGSASNMTPQQSAMANARTAVPSYAASAAAAAKALWTEQGASLLNVYIHQYCPPIDEAADRSFTEAELAVVRSVAQRLAGVMQYIDSAIRQGLVGYLASTVDDVEAFTTLRDTLENAYLPLSAILEASPVELPDNFRSWVTTVDENKLALQNTVAACNTLRGGSYTRSQFQPLLDSILQADGAYMNEWLMDDRQAYLGMMTDNMLTLTGDAGVLADIADYVGDQTILFMYDADTNVQVETLSLQDTPYLTQLAQLLNSLEAAAGDSELVSTPLRDVYGFAMDFAFRSNIACDLLLQTEAVDRIESAERLPELEGGGSYMEFTSEQLTEQQIVEMMDAVRIAFVDNRSAVLAVAKLNTSNYTAQDGAVSAPLYLYEHMLTDTQLLVTGERRKEDGVIAPLTQGTPYIVTAIMWLDGDCVGNNHAAIAKQSMSGLLNLQFSSSVTLNMSDIQIKPSE